MYKKIFFKEIDSTNTYALKNIANLEDRQIIIADTQLSGRGRFQRNWVSSDSGNIYMSIVLKPSSIIHPNLPLANITQYMSVVLCRILENYGVKADIKWPNDVLAGGKKIAGILSEASIKGQTLNGLVLGVGINLNLSKEALNSINQPATSLNLLINQPVSRDVFIKKLLDEFFSGYEEFIEKGFLAIKFEYETKISCLGKSIIINLYGEKENGIAQSINDDGALILLKGNNEKRIVTMGDIIAF